MIVVTAEPRTGKTEVAINALLATAKLVTSRPAAQPALTSRITSAHGVFGSAILILDVVIDVLDEGDRLFLHAPL